MDEPVNVSRKFAQIALYSVLLIAMVAVLAVLLPMLFGGAQETPRLAQMPLPRAAPPPTPPPPPRLDQLERMRRALADDIRSGTVTVEPVEGWIAVRIGNLGTFEPAQATVLPGFSPLGRRIASVVEVEQGPVRIIGHTDNQALSGSSTFRDNQDLSIARARAVSALISAGLTDAARIAVEGRGAAQPIGDNATAEGRSRNRRVEILVAREP
ncbi:OmpA family protein [Phreatobacter sp.]|uniref:OmpA family protein n=1 Tax=Phreatobacter sp. TaxID=1966341 RepID=UPI00273344DD|nr:OmpA family protein [Phreatobacter sp.]